MKRATIQKVEDAIVERYCKDATPLTVLEIREECQLSLTIIRKAAIESRRIDTTSKDVAIMSKNYPWLIHQHRAVDAFQPTREWLVEIIQTAARAETWRQHSTGRGFT
jgi:hypothetical protein